MRIRDNISNGDKLKIAAMALPSIVAAVTYYFLKLFELKDVVILTVFCLLFLATFIFSFEYNYSFSQSIKNIHHDISKMAIVYCVFFVISAVVAGFVIDCPIYMAVGIAFCMVMPFNSGIILTMYYCVFFAVVYRCSVYEIAIYLIIGLFGGMLSFALKRERFRFYLIFAEFMLPVTLLYLLQYINGRTTDYKLLVNNIVIAFINVLVIQVYFILLDKLDKPVKPLSMEYVLNDKFPLVLLMKNASVEKYNHARKVGLLSSRLAKHIKADVEVSTIAGFYYAMCDNDEDDPIEFALDLGRKNDLPGEVIDILSAYKGIKRPIFSREGAVIEIADHILTTLPSRVREEVPINLTIMAMMNDMSKTGILDESGLSMNSFIKARDYLAEELSDYDG